MLGRFQVPMSFRGIRIRSQSDVSEQRSAFGAGERGPGGLIASLAFAFGASRSVDVFEEPDSTSAGVSSVVRDAYAGSSSSAIPAFETHPGAESIVWRRIRWSWAAWCCT